MRLNHRYLAAGTAALMTMLSVLSPAAALAAGESLLERITLTQSGGQATGQFPAISADGRSIAFASTSNNLVAGDTNAKQDIFVRDRLTNTLERVSVSSAGVQANGANAGAALSADGRYVAFYSNATNLGGVPDTNAAYDVFVHDRMARSTELVSVSATGQAGNAGSMNAAISGDGRIVAFASDATNLVDGDTNGSRDVFVRDRQLGTTLRIGVAADYPAVSSDGRYVAFSSTDINGVDGSKAGIRHIYVWDRETGGLERASVSDTGAAGGGASMFPSLSGDGRFVAFESDASNLVVGDTNSRRDVFVRDRQSGTTERVSVTNQGVQSKEASNRASISGDGMLVVFESTASDIVAGDSNRVKDVFLHNRVTRQTRRVSLTNQFAEANQASFGQVISQDGSAIAFHSSASNLVTGDSNAAMDTFVARTALVPPPPDFTKLVIPGVKVMEGDPIEVSSILTANGTPVADRLVQFDVGGDGAGQGRTGSDGVARVTYPWTLRPGSYSIRAFFRGDLSFAKSISYGTLRVGDPNTNLTLTNLSADPGRSVLLTTVLTTAQGEPLAGRSVTFSVNESTVGTVSTDTQGKAQLSYVVPEELGEHGVLVTFDGDSTYHPASATAVLKVLGVVPATMVALDEQVSYGSGALLQAILKREEVGVQGQPVKFLVNGVEIGTATTDTLGNAIIGYTALLAPGTYEWTATAALETTVEATGSLTVAAATATLSYTGDTLAIGDPFKLQAKLTAAGMVENPAPVTFELLQGTGIVGTYQAPLNENKVAEVTLPSLWGDHTVRVSWPNDLYKAQTVQAQIQGPVKPTLELTGPADPAWTRPNITLITTARTGAQVVVYGREKLTGAIVGEVTVRTGTSGTANVVFPSLPDGDYEFWPEADRLVGNTVTVFKDSTAPVTTLLYPAPNAHGWYNTPVTVQAEAIDPQPGIGVARLEYRSGDEWLLYRVEGISVEAEGRTIVCVRATDRAGNEEACRPLEVAIDLLAPEVSLQFDAGRSEFTLTASDSLSGVDRTEYSLDGGQVWLVYELPVALPRDDQYTVRYRSIDLAGNERYGTASVVVDRTPPVITVSGVAAGSEHDRSATPVWGVTDAMSGVSWVTATLDGRPWQSGDVVTAAGPHTLVVTAEDNAGNRSEATMIFMVYHSSEVVLQPVSAQYSDPVQLTATVLSNGAPVAGAQVTFSVANQPVGTAITEPDGIARLRYVVTNPAGQYSVTVAYTPDESAWQRPAAAQTTLTVTQEQAAIAMTADRAQFAARVTQELDGFPGDLALLQVRFLVQRFNSDGTATQLPPLTAAVSSAGEAVVSPNLPEGVYAVTAELVPNPYFTAPAVSAGGTGATSSPASTTPVAGELSTLAVSDGKGFTTGGVWWGDKERAEFQVRPDQKGATGMLQVRTAGLDLRITQFDWLVVDAAGMQFQGRSGSYVVKVAGTPAKGRQPLRFSVTVLQNGVEVYAVRSVQVQGSVNVQP